MAIEINPEQNGRLLVVRATGKLVKADYEKLVPAMDHAVQQHEAIQMLVELHDFHGWTAGALWEDAKFAAHHFDDIGQLAVVGEKKWQAGMVAFSQPFTTASVRYFDHTQMDAARAWLQSEMQLTA